MRKDVAVRGVTGANPPKFSMAPQLLLSMASDKHKFKQCDKLRSLQLVFFLRRKAGFTPGFSLHISNHRAY
jgi:hypothetical protein